MQTVLGAFRAVHLTAQLPMLFLVAGLLPDPIQVLVLTFKAICGLGPGYLRNHLTPMAHPTCYGRISMWYISSVKKFQLVGSKRTFLPSLKVISAPTLSVQGSKASSASWPGAPVGLFHVVSGYWTRKSRPVIFWFWVLNHLIFFSLIFNVLIFCEQLSGLELSPHNHKAVNLILASSRYFFCKHC